MATNRTQQLKTTTVDLSGLPEPVVEQVLRLVHDARQKQAEASPNQDDPDRWATAAEAVKGLTDYDFGAWEEQRAFDAKHAADHLK